MLRFHEIDFDASRLGPLLRRAGVVRTYLFGSVLTPTFRPDSDIDLLIETDDIHPPGVLTLGGLQMDLSDLLGRNVHLTLLAGIPEGERPAVLSKATLLNAA